MQIYAGPAARRYRRLHAAVWPGVLKKITECNIRNYVIHPREPENLLFSHFEYHGDNWDRDAARMAGDPVTQEWWRACGPCQRQLDTASKGEWWVPMEEVFLTRNFLPWHRRPRAVANRATSTGPKTGRGLSGGGRRCDVGMRGRNLGSGLVQSFRGADPAQAVLSQRYLDSTALEMQQWFVLEANEYTGLIDDRL